MVPIHGPPRVGGSIDFIFECEILASDNNHYRKQSSLILAPAARGFGVHAYRVQPNSRALSLAAYHERARGLWSSFGCGA
jgi:hypothetical protein